MTPLPAASRLVAPVVSLVGAVLFAALSIAVAAPVLPVA